MSDNKERYGYFQDANGDLSSGRAMKLVSFAFAMVLTTLGGTAIFFASEALAPELNSYLIAVIALFLGVATSAELVQKITGK